MVLILAACALHHEPVRASSPQPLDVVVALSTVVDPAVTGPSASLQAALAGAMDVRNVSPTWVSDDKYVSLFQSTRDTRRRTALLGSTQALLLVETETAYYSELSGRFRWTVHTTLTLEPAGLTDTFDVPVFLQFAHEKEPEAVEAAAPTIARHVGELLDGWLSAP